MHARSMEQERMKQDMAALQRALEMKERRMQDLMGSSGQVCVCGVGQLGPSPGGFGGSGAFRFSGALKTGLALVRGVQ
jgi:hypothetical protein